MVVFGYAFTRCMPYLPSPSGIPFLKIPKSTLPAHPAKRYTISCPLGIPYSSSSPRQLRSDGLLVRCMPYLTRLRVCHMRLLKIYRPNRPLWYVRRQTPGPALPVAGGSTLKQPRHQHLPRTRWRNAASRSMRALWGTVAVSVGCSLCFSGSKAGTDHYSRVFAVMLAGK